MFAIEGYVPAISVVRKVREILSEGGSSCIDARLTELSGPARDQFMDLSYISHFLKPHMVLMRVLEAELINGYVCSTKGNVLRASGDLFALSPALHITALDPLNADEDFLSISRRFEGAEVFQLADKPAVDDCPFISMELWRVREEGDLKKYAGSLAEVRPAFVVSAALVSGWFVCLRDDASIKNIADVVIGAYAGVEKEIKLKLGSSDTRILEDVLQAFPDGKSEPWGVVESKVGYSRRSIERALAATGRKDWKNSTGQG